MGTKIEYTVNPLGNIKLRDPAQFCVDDWVWKKKSVGISMDRMFDNIDSIKKTMEMHEHTFKHQVQELHRLYSVQKVLMNDLKQRKFRDPMNNNNNNNDNNKSYSNNPEVINWNKLRIMRDDQNYREGSGSCSRGGFDLERPVEELISTVGEDSDIELTLSIGSGLMNKKRTISEYNGVKELDSSASFKADREGESDPNTPMSSSSATFDQDRKHPHWLFHGGLKL